jgi:hypothetical protein
MTVTFGLSKQGRHAGATELAAAFWRLIFVRRTKRGSQNAVAHFNYCPGNRYRLRLLLPLVHTQT